MLINLKAMVVVLSIAAVVFYLARPICLRFMSAQDFARRRNVWFVLTAVAFVSPNFWLYVAVGLPVVFWAGRKDSNPVALYLLILLIVPPNIRLDIPIVGINKLFEFSHLRLLAVALLLPAAWKLLRDKAAARLGAMDALLLAFGVLQLILLAPHQSLTHTMRHAFLFTLDVLLLYYVASRTCTNRRVIDEVMASFCLACAIFAPLAAFESVKGWLLYEGIASLWGTPIEFLFLVRDNALRASVSAGQAIPLGHLFALGFGFLLYLGSRLQSRRLSIVFALWMWVGLLAAYSRAPWIVAAAIYFVYVGLGPNGLARLSKAMVVSAIGAALVLVSPLGGRVIDNLPFVGTVDAANVTYRQALFELSMELVMAKPFFGDPFYLDNLEALRQGQGIVDMLNYMATIALAFGLVGLALYLGFFLLAMAKAFRLIRTPPGSDAALPLLGACLFACMFGGLLAMVMGGYGPSVQCVGLVMAGIAAGSTRLFQPAAPATRAGRLAQQGQ